MAQYLTQNLSVTDMFFNMFLPMLKRQRYLEQMSWHNCYLTDHVSEVRCSPMAAYVIVTDAGPHSLFLWVSLGVG